MSTRRPAGRKPAACRRARHYATRDLGRQYPLQGVQVSKISGGRAQRPATGPRVYRDRPPGGGTERGLLARAPRAVEGEVRRLGVGRVVPPAGEAHIRYRAALRDPVPAAYRDVEAALEHVRA